LGALELPREARSDAKLIRTAYRRLALKWHPDKNLGVPSDQSRGSSQEGGPNAQAFAAEMFKKVTGAYHFLTTVNFDYERWSRNFVIPPLQTLGDVFELAMKGEDVEAVLRARGEYRPHPEFGINLNVPWSAGTQYDPSWDTPSTSYTTTKEIAGSSSVSASHSEPGGQALVPSGMHTKPSRSAPPSFSPDDKGFVSMAAGVTPSILPRRPKVSPSDSEAPDIAEEFNERGMGHFKAKQWDLALAEYTEAVMLQPDKVAYRGNRAAAALKLGRNNIAIEDSLEATRLDSTYIKGYVRAGRGYLNLGEYMNSRRQFAKALELDPDDKMAKKGMKELNEEQSAAADVFFDAEG